MAVVAKPGIELEPHQIVYRPLVTEKGTHLSERYNAYTFEVNAQASKPQIKAAVETLWKVRVLRVRTQNRVGKPRRHKMVHSYTQAWKKAIVELHPDDRIAFF
uniref:Large ribosomal subunit protein uL23 n=1 Tax=Schlesneria paludicola TaxID=360056 RepID=A0A7C2NYT4_9PLAN